MAEKKKNKIVSKKLYIDYMLLAVSIVVIIRNFKVYLINRPISLRKERKNTRIIFL